MRVLDVVNCPRTSAGLAFAKHRGATAEPRAGLLARVGLAEGRRCRPTSSTYIDQKRLELARALALEAGAAAARRMARRPQSDRAAEGIALIRSLRDSGITIMLVEHVMDAIRSLCDRCVVMNAGRKIAEGLADAVLADPEVVARLSRRRRCLRSRHISSPMASISALDNVELDVAHGEIVVILGANGAGKTSLLKAIAGWPATALDRARRPRSHWRCRAHAIVEAGVALVPEGRGMFGELTVRENLELGAYRATRARRGGTRR
ncbi:MAG: ATP-binding cassette domain-containing protein [Ferruginibacter sp.]